MKDDFTKLKVCIIGAGVTGLCAARHLIAAGIKPVVLERNDVLGGIWVYNEKVGLDKYGLPIHTSMYKNLSTNLPKPIMCFPDYPMPDEFDSFPPAKDVLNFLQSYSDANDVTSHIKFNHYVKLVKRHENIWHVKYVDLKMNKEIDDEFDYVIVCNGHFNTPNIPDIKGIDSFNGDVMHSHDYRIPEVFTDKKVLVIGAGYSGLDISLEIVTVAKKLFLSHHSKEKLKFAFPGSFEEKPDVQEIDGNKVRFINGTTEEIDIILYCTGYLYNYPFLDPSCGIKVEENYVQPLYKHMINVEHPTMCLIGLQFQICAFPMFDLQARYYAKFIQGGFQLPSKEQMYAAIKADFEERMKRGYKKKHAHVLGPMQAQYYDSVADEASIPSLPHVMSKIHTKVGQMLKSDIINLKKHSFHIINEDEFELKTSY